MFSGQPVTIVAMGGSITCGGETRALEEQWSYRVFLWINETFPHANPTYVNQCKPATPSMVVGACLTVPDHIDLVLMEVGPSLASRSKPCQMQHLPYYASLTILKTVQNAHAWRARRVLSS